LAKIEGRTSPWSQGAGAREFLKEAVRNYYKELLLDSNPGMNLI